MGKPISIVLLIQAVALLACVDWAKATPPPVKPVTPAKVADERTMIAVPMTKANDVEWHLERNFAHGMRLKSTEGNVGFRGLLAVNVSELDQTQRREAGMRPREKKSLFAIWLKKFDDPNLDFTNGYASVVDQDVFSDLRMVDGQFAKDIDRAGVVVGSVKLKEYDPIELTEFLVGSGIIDANIHVKAKVTGTHFTSELGHWFKFHSDDPYWTNQSNRASYDFGVHIATDGTIRLINAEYVGRLLKQNESKGDVPQTK